MPLQKKNMNCNTRPTSFNSDFYSTDSLSCTVKRLTPLIGSLRLTKVPCYYNTEFSHPHDHNPQSHQFYHLQLVHHLDKHCKQRKLDIATCTNIYTSLHNNHMLCCINVCTVELVYWTQPSEMKLLNHFDQCQATSI